MKFFEALKITRGITAAIGGGGKTSLLLRLASELSGDGGVIVCTSTHMFRPDGMPVLTGASMEEVKAALMAYPVICVGENDGEKLTAPKLGTSALAALCNYVFCEADGSKQLPLKAHALHEPVLPDGANVIYVVGADGIGKPICIAVHRPELYAARLGTHTGHIVTPADAAKMVDCGGTVFFNKAETPLDIANGREFAAHFRGRTVIASLWQNKVIEVIE